MDPSGIDAKRICQDSDEDTCDSDEDEEAAAPGVARTHRRKTRESLHKDGPRFRGTGKALEKDPKKRWKDS